MRIEHLGAVSRAKKNEGVSHAFLLSLSSNLESIKNTNKKIVLIGGASKEYFEAEALLGHQGIFVDVYADSSFGMSGKYFGGKFVCSTYDLLEKPEKYYFVIVGPAKSPMNRINDILIQLKFHDVSEKNISIFFEAQFHDFADENQDLETNIMGAINEIGFENMQSGTIPTFGNASGPISLDAIAPVSFLYSTTYSQYVYLWEWEYLQRAEKSRILEIGPGDGLMSLVLLNRFPNIKIDWVLFGDQPFALSGGLKKIKEKYSNRVAELYGKIEKSDFILPENTYDMIIMTEVFEHFGFNPVSTMKKIQKALRKNGCMVLSTPNWGHVHIYKNWREMPKCSNISDEAYMKLLTGHTYQYTKSEMEEIFTESGFAVEIYAESESNNHNFFLRACLK